MKKITLLLITIALVCTSVFALDFSFTVGGGYCYKTPMKRENWENIAGPGVFVGVDFTLKNGITIYNDIEVNSLRVQEDYKVIIEGYNTAEKLGVGYTLNKGDWDIMFGAGPELQLLFEEHEGDDAPKASCEARIGLGARIKGSYNCTERLAISVQTDPSIVFKALDHDPLVHGAEFSTNFLVGLTFKY